MSDFPLRIEQLVKRSYFFDRKVWSEFDNVVSTQNEILQIKVWWRERMRPFLPSNDKQKNNNNMGGCNEKYDCAMIPKDKPTVELNLFLTVALQDKIHTEI